MKRPTGPLCDGCHSVNYDIENKTVTEWNVGCEKCHGPGSEHAARPSRLNIVNPARLDSVQANGTCIQCHSQGNVLDTQRFGAERVRDDLGVLMELVWPSPVVIDDVDVALFNAPY